MSDNREPVVIECDKKDIAKIKNDKTSRLDKLSKALDAATMISGIALAVDIVIPDTIPFIDEALLTGLTMLLRTASSVTKNKAEELRQNGKMEFKQEEANSIAYALKNVIDAMPNSKAK